MKHGHIFTALFAVILLLTSCGGKQQKAKDSNDQRPKKVLVLSSSPRKGGNSDLLCDRFMAGAQEAGHQVEKIFLNDKTIHFFAGDDYREKTGSYAPADDVPAIVQKMVSADVIVMATPVYFYAMCGQMKTLIDRTFERYQEISDKEFYFIVTAADRGKEAAKCTIEEFRGFIRCLNNATERGIVYGMGAGRKGAVEGMPAMDEAYEMGKNI